MGETLAETRARFKKMHDDDMAKQQAGSGNSGLAVKKADSAAPAAAKASDPCPSCGQSMPENTVSAIKKNRSALERAMSDE